MKKLLAVAGILFALDTVSMLESATAPLRGLFERTKELLAPGTCTPLYEGTVAHPG